MIARFAVVVATLLAASLACAETLSPDAARRFVAGKLFAFNCFDGSRGAGRIYGDGSVIGTIQFRGAGPVRSVWLPARTRRGGGDGRRLILRLEFARSSARVPLASGTTPYCQLQSIFTPDSVTAASQSRASSAKLGAKFPRRQAPRLQAELGDAHLEFVNEPRGQRLCSSRALRRSKACTHKSGSASAARPCPLR